MSQPTMQSTISSDGSLAAVIVPTAATSSRLLIQIYQVGASSCSLQLTLAHSTSNPLKEIVFCGNSMVVGLMGTSEVVVWDLERGVVANKLMASSEEQSFLAVAGGPDGKHFSILTRHSQKRMRRSAEYLCIFPKTLELWQLSDNLSGSPQELHQHRPQI